MSFTAKVNDRCWQDMQHGVKFISWPEDPVPPVGARVVLFDRNLDFTQHDVVWRGAHRRLKVGPAIAWPQKGIGR